MRAMVDEEVNRISGQVVDAALKIHSTLGPGLLESAYETCLEYEMSQRGFGVRRQVALPVIYEGIKLEAGYRIDLLIEGKVIVELKSVEKLMPVHEAQLLSYLRLSGCEIGLLLNFNVDRLKSGIRRLVYARRTHLQHSASSATSAVKTDV